MNGIPFLDAIPVNWFILGTSLLAGIILYLILTQIPDDDEPEEKTAVAKEPERKEQLLTPRGETKPKSKKKASRRK